MARFEELEGRRVFMTGGTGFMGCSLLECLLGAVPGALPTVLTRDEAAFRRRRPRLAESPAISLLRGGIRTFEFPKEKFPFVIHAARPSRECPEVILEDCRRALEMAKACSAERFLFISSGAVYGPQPEGLSHLPESYKGSPETEYGKGKQAAELLCADYARRHGFKAMIARGFAFCGPYLPLDGPFAAGNFIRDALMGGPIRILGDGTPYRSYLHGSEMAEWLWTILLRGQDGRVYNVGSEARLTISELAGAVVRAIRPGLEIVFEKKPVPGKAPEQYIPSTERARTELGLTQRVPLEDSIRLTAAWARG